MEDRTEALNIDVMDVFLSGLTQEQIDALSQERLDKLHKRAAKQAEQEVPNQSKSTGQSITLQRMKTLCESFCARFE
ncbi:hypothetical protein [Salinibacter grassmerensis]|uniref:hypothetical protein n=1 Tax=Salinibacter grassmerensis TaxID=3040353 RepID=UPI0021E8ED95|nr:hypothetical protein [Salinibacter grassmerensis]